MSSHSAGNLSLSDINLHLLLALSGQENLLIQLPEPHLLDSLCSRIAGFCSSSRFFKRSFHAVPQGLAHTAGEEADILGQFFITPQEDKEREGQVPQVLVISSLDDYPSHLQIALKAILRNKRFEYDGQTFNLPEDFILVGVVNDWEKLPPFIVSLLPCPLMSLFIADMFV